MGWVRRPINGVKFTPSEMDVMFKAFDALESQCMSVEAMYGTAARKRTTNNPEHLAFCRRIARDSRKRQKLAESARHKWWRVCLGMTDDSVAQMERLLTEAAKGTMHDAYVPLDAALRIITKGSRETS